jgi:tryptophan-rich sensory protein
MIFNDSRDTSSNYAIQKLTHLSYNPLLYRLSLGKLGPIICIALTLTLNHKFFVVLTSARSPPTNTR